MRHPVLSLFLGAVASLATGAQAETLNVRLILSDSSAPYQQFATTFSKSLANINADVTVTESHAASSTKADLVVTVGIKAAEFAASSSDIPVLAVMIPKAGYEALPARPSLQKSSRQISAIYLEQTWDRQLDFLRAALPKHRRIGLLYSESTQIDMAHLRQDISMRGASLVTRPVSSAEQLFSSLDAILDDIDVLLAIPDSTIYSSGSIRNILLTSYRHGVPLIGLSQSYVTAGALTAIFSTPEQLAEQAGLAVTLFARTGHLPESQYPAKFTIAVNQQVARSLGIELPSPEAIRRLMDKVKEE